MRLGLRQLLAIITVSALLLLGIWSYGSALLNPSPPLGSHSPQYPIVITSVITRDINGNPQTTFERGDVIVFDVTIEYPRPYYYYNTLPTISYLELLETFDPEDVVISIGFTQDRIDPGGVRRSGTGFKVPATAPTGTYTLWVFIWNHWVAQPEPPWVPYSESYTVTFSVT